MHILYFCLYVDEKNQRETANIAEDEFLVDLFAEDDSEDDYIEGSAQDYYDDSIRVDDEDDDDNSDSRAEIMDIYSSSDFSNNVGMDYINYDDPVVHVSHSTQHRQLTAGDIGLVVGIALACGFFSFLITAVSCHFLMKRRKNVGQKISMVAGKAPSSAWTYQDVMPTTPEITPLVQPQTQSRITSV